MAVSKHETEKTNLAYQIGYFVVGPVVVAGALTALVVGVARLLGF